MSNQATDHKGDQQRPAPRLYLVVDGHGEPDDTTVLAALAAGDVACLLHSSAGPALSKSVQEQGVALLRAPDVSLKGADGIHVDGGLAGFHEKADGRSPGILGIGGISTRHDGMIAAETAVDYVAFGRLCEAEAPLPLETRLDLVEWWQDMMILPCVASAVTLDEVAALSKAGADFVALSRAVWAADDAALAVRGANDALALEAQPA